MKGSTWNELLELYKAASERELRLLQKVISFSDGMADREAAHRLLLLLQEHSRQSQAEVQEVAK